MATTKPKAMNVIKTHIDGVLILEPHIFKDKRGFFYESYSEKTFKDAGITDTFIQDNHVKSGKGVLRGLHYQAPPRAQAKLVRVIRGAIYDVCVDLRHGSPTFGEYVGIDLDADNKRMVYVPTGFAHGYLTLENDTEVLYKVSDTYAPETERGVLWNDEHLAIKWPKLDTEFEISEKDLKLPLFSELSGKEFK